MIRIKDMTKTKPLIIFAITFFVVLIVSLISFFEIKYRDSFYPGVIIAGEPASGKKYSEVSNYFENKIDFINKNGITFNIIGVNGEKKVQFPEFSKGLTTDKVVEHFSLNNWEDTLKEAYSFGRRGSIWQKINEQFKSLSEKRNFVFKPTIQKDTADSFFADELEDFLAETSPAEFVIKDGKISLLPETIGEKIDPTKITDILEKKLSTADNSSADIKTEENLPDSTIGKLNIFLSPAEKIKSFIGISFYYNNYTWKVSGDTIVTWITIKPDGKPGIDENKLEEYFNKTVIGYIDSPMQNSRFEMQNNKLIEISKGKSGNVVDITKTTQDVESVISEIISNPETIIENKNINIPIEITAEEPRITQETINKYKIKELVGSDTTNFEGASLDRQHNIEVGVSKLNGILLAPGEEFSTVNGIGNVTKEAGFVKESVIANGKTQKELGGGLCQLATTLFRLALNSGLPITERVNHRYVVPYYGPGLDATIYEPQPDLKFVNDTGNYLLLQGKVENNEVTFEFYGKKDGRIVEISKPKLYNIISPPDPKYIPTDTLAVGKIICTEVPHDGVTADTTYTVSYKNRDAKETVFHSVYQPWQKVCLIGTK